MADDQSSASVRRELGAAGSLLADARRSVADGVPADILVAKALVEAKSAERHRLRGLLEMYAAGMRGRGAPASELDEAIECAFEKCAP